MPVKGTGYDFPFAGDHGRVSRNAETMKQVSKPVFSNNKTVEPTLIFDRQTPVTVQVHHHLRQLILKLQLKPGEALSEKDLSLKLGVSRTPVREAFIKLSEEGLVDIFPQRGTLVAPIRIADIQEAQFLRVVLETAIVRQAAKSIDPTHLDQLDENLRQQKQNLKSKNYDALMDLDEAFHHLLCEGVSLPRAWRVIHTVKGQLDRVRYYTLPRPGHGEMIVRQHAEILDAVRDGDADAAEKKMHEHLEEIWNSIERMSQENNEIL